MSGVRFLWNRLRNTILRMREMCEMGVALRKAGSRFRQPNRRLSPAWLYVDVPSSLRELGKNCVEIGFSELYAIGGFPCLGLTGWKDFVGRTVFRFLDYGVRKGVMGNRNPF